MKKDGVKHERKKNDKKRLTERKDEKRDGILISTETYK